MKKSISLIISAIFVLSFILFATASTDKKEVASLQTVPMDTQENIRDSDGSFVSSPYNTQKSTSIQTVTSVEKNTTTTSKQKVTSPPVISTKVDVVTSATKSNSNFNQSSDINEVVNFYNTAKFITDNNNSVKNTAVYRYRDDATISGEGDELELAYIRNVIGAATEARSVYKVNGVPGLSVNVNDVKEVYSESSDDLAYICIVLKDQQVTSNSNSGSVSRTFGAPATMNDVYDLLGINIKSGAETISVSYTDAYIKCYIDKNTGEITEGYWYYDITVNMGNVVFESSDLTLNARNMVIPLEYFARVG